jgi:hypothetical protein
MKPAPISAEKRADLARWLIELAALVESGEVSCVAAYMQKTKGGGAIAVKGELVDTDAVYGLNQLVQKIQDAATRLKVVT